MKRDKKLRLKLQKEHTEAIRAVEERIEELTECMDELADEQKKLVKKNKTAASLMKEILQWKTQFEGYMKYHMEAEMKEQMEMFSEGLEKILKNAGAVAYRTEPGELFHYKKHQLAAFVKTEDQTKTGTIKASVSDGYLFCGEVILEEAVEIYKAG